MTPASSCPICSEIRDLRVAAHCARLHASLDRAHAVADRRRTQLDRILRLLRHTRTKETPTR